MQNTTKFTPILLLIGATLAPLAASANCWDEASRDYGIPVDVLKAVAKTESGFRAEVVNKNTDKSKDIGIMQINSKWIPTLNKFGIAEKDLFDACTNIKVGAWILSKNSERLGWNWDAIGAYNVGCAKLSKTECDRRRASYSWKVYSALQKSSVVAAVPAASRAQVVSAGLELTQSRKLISVAVSDDSSPRRALTPDSFLAYAETEVETDE